jgi:regulator of RNase E activity RraA
MITDETLRQLEEFDSCSISNAIEQFRVRTRNDGFVDGSVHCIFPEFPPKAGYAATARIRSSSTPVTGRCYYDRADWWSYVQTVPGPRFIVLQDIDHSPGFGALFGEVHSNICKALNCAAVVTNGAVRDLPGVRNTGLQLFAGNVAVSHAYAHIVDFGEPVEIGGLQIKPGQLLHGDRHGVVCVPLEIAAEVPRVASEMATTEKELIEYCHSEAFSFRTLCEKIQHISRKANPPDKDSA